MFTLPTFVVEDLVRKKFTGLILKQYLKRSRSLKRYIRLFFVTIFVLTESCLGLVHTVQINMISTLEMAPDLLIWLGSWKIHPKGECCLYTYMQLFLDLHQFEHSCIMALMTKFLQLFNSDLITCLMNCMQDCTYIHQPSLRFACHVSLLRLTALCT